MASIYQLARQRIAGATIKAPTKKVTLSEFGHIVKAKEPKKSRNVKPDSANIPTTGI